MNAIAKTEFEPLSAARKLGDNLLACVKDYAPDCTTEWREGATSHKGHYLDLKNGEKSVTLYVQLYSTDATPNIAIHFCDNNSSSWEACDRQAFVWAGNKEDMAGLPEIQVDTGEFYPLGYYKSSREHGHAGYTLGQYLQRHLG